jgi:hypothetical protein
LVETDVLLKTTGADSIEETQSAQAVNISRVFGHFEGDFDVGLGTEIVDLGGLHLCDDVHEIGAIAQITIMQLELVRVLMLVFIQMMQTTSVETR